MSKVWFITGSSRGLGRSLAEAVLAAGDRLVATARRPEDLHELVGPHGGRAPAVPFVTHNADLLAALAPGLEAALDERPGGEGPSPTRFGRPCEGAASAPRSRRSPKSFA